MTPTRLERRVGEGAALDPSDEPPVQGLFAPPGRWEQGIGSARFLAALSLPPMVNVHVVKPGERAGFDRVAHRGPRIIGVCNHITDGDPPGDELVWYQKFFSTGGERAWDALTDTVLGRDGRLGLLNDWRDPDWGGRRAGWANGTANGLEGDGVAFYRNYPLINDVLVSIEHVARSGQALTEEQFATSVELSTAIAQSVKCPWDKYPSHPGFNGVNIEQMHKNFAPKACPAEPLISAFSPETITAVRAKRGLMANRLNEQLDCPVSAITDRYGTNQVAFPGAKRLGAVTPQLGETTITCMTPVSR